MLHKLSVRTVLCILLVLSLLFAVPVPLYPAGAEEAEPGSGLLLTLVEKEPVSVILLEGGEELTWTCGVPFTDPGYTAYGREGEDMTDSVTVKGKVRAWRVGSYTLSYRLKDSKGTIARVKRTVKVVKAKLPDTVKQPKKTIYLTFDDGPGPYTEKVLKILDKYGIKATFFIVASRSRCEEILPKIAAAGHTIGIHAYRHHIPTLYESEESFFSDFLHAQKIVRRYTGSYATVARLPGGGKSASFLVGQYAGRYKTFEKRMHNMGIRYYDWDIQPESGFQTTEGTYQSFVYFMKKQKGPTIVLQHDTRYYSVQALEQMIQWGLDHGYTFLPIDQTTPEVHFTYQFPNS